MEYKGNEPIRTLLPNQLEGHSLSGTGDFSRIAKEENQDRSKGDIVSKGVVVLQTGWFVIQCIARWKQGLPITELALVTIAYAVLNFVIYWMWWDKPLNVQRAVRVYWKCNPEEASTNGLVPTNGAGFCLTLRRSLSAIPSAIADELQACMPNFRWPILRPILWPIAKLTDVVVGSGDVVADGKRVHTFYPATSQSESENTLRFVVPVAVAAVFGTIHCIAWQFAFASETERRVGSVTITASPFILPLALVLATFCGNFSE